MQIDLVEQKGPIYKFFFNGIDVFTKYLFAVPLTNISADTVARELVKIFFQHSFLPSTLLSDLGTNFTSKLKGELTKLLEVKLKHATLKHPQTIGVLERSHAALKRILKLNSNELRNDWHKYVPLATFIHNTSYHSSRNCCPTTLFHGRQPVEPLDLRFSTRAMQAVEVNSEYVSQLQHAMLQKFGENKQRLLDSYQRYRSYYDQKAEAQPLKLHSYCLQLNPRLTGQNDFTQKAVQTWVPLYRVEKVLTNSNYIIRKTGTNYTQCVHRIRLRPIKLTEPPEHIQEIDPAKFEADPSRRTTRNGPELLGEYIPNLLEEEQSTAFSKTVTVQPSQKRIGVPVPLNGAPALPLVAPVPPMVTVIPPIPVIPLAEIRTPSPMNSPINSQENSPRANFSDSPESIATREEFQYPDSHIGATESERVTANDEADTEQQPGPSTRSNQNRVNFAKMRGVRKFESSEPVARYGSRSQMPRLPESPTQLSILTKEQKKPNNCRIIAQNKKGPNSNWRNETRPSLI